MIQVPLNTDAGGEEPARGTTSQPFGSITSGVTRSASAWYVIPHASFEYASISGEVARAVCRGPELNREKAASDPIRREPKSTLIR